MGGGGTDDAVRERPKNSSELSWASLACGGAHTLALTRDGQLYAWGRDEGEGCVCCLRGHPALLANPLNQSLRRMTTQHAGVA